MNFKYFKNAIEISKVIMERTISPGDTVIDCTVGNGNDTISLAELVGSNGKVYGFDIQNRAIESTRNKLKDKNLLDRVILINDGHENLLHYVKEKVNFIVFNLGYLPQGDKNIVTRPNTTIKAIEESLKILTPGGIILTTCYISHDGGLEEMKKVEEYLSNLNQKEYSTLKFRFINQINNPPILYGVEKQS